MIKKALGAVVVACILLAPAALAAPNAKSGATPLKGKMDGDWNMLYYWGGQKKISVPATGQVSHLGQSNIEGVLTIYGYYSGAARGLLTLTAANGDYLRVYINGYQDRVNEKYIVSGTYSIDGGTGRFTDATGEGTVEITSLNGDLDLRLNGFIDYNAAHRSGK